MSIQLSAEMDNELAYVDDLGKDHSQTQNCQLYHVFNTKCPPKIAPNTRVIRLCGPNDFRNNASPENDGWILADFYLYHHLLKDASTHQTWLTCVQPKVLVSKYQEYVHEDETGERRIVLDEAMLSETSDIRVIDTSQEPAKGALLGTFLETLRTECLEAKRNDQTLLVLIFAHGQKDTYSICIGGHQEGYKAPQLQRETFRRAIPQHTRVAMFTTSCYGGGWAQVPRLNISESIATGTGFESLPWPSSSSSIRFCGSRYTPALAKVLIRRYYTDERLDHNNYIRLEYDDLTSATYNQLEDIIRHRLREEVDSKSCNTVSFSATDDKRATEWQAPAGATMFPDYEVRWKKLRLAEVIATTNGDSEAGPVQLSCDRPPYSYQQAVQLVKQKAILYLASHPGLDEAAKNHYVHGTARKLLRGKSLSPEELCRISSALDYRQYIMAQANVLRDEFGLSYADCEDVDPSYMHMEAGMFHCMCGHYLYSEPCDDEDWHYAKGERYLAVAVSAAGWSLEKAERETKRVKQVIGNFREAFTCSESYTDILSAQRERFALTAETFGLDKSRSIRGTLVTLADLIESMIERRLQEERERGAAWQQEDNSLDF